MGKSEWQRGSTMQYYQSVSQADIQCCVHLTQHCKPWLPISLYLRDWSAKTHFQKGMEFRRYFPLYMLKGSRNRDGQSQIFTLFHRKKRKIRRSGHYGKIQFFKAELNPLYSPLWQCNLQTQQTSPSFFPEFSILGNFDWLAQDDLTHTQVSSTPEGLPP